MAGTWSGTLSGTTGHTSHKSKLAVLFSCMQHNTMLCVVQWEPPNKLLIALLLLKINPSHCSVPTQATMINCYSHSNNQKSCTNFIVIRVN